jgi:signal transduction histidine kinase
MKKEGKSRKGTGLPVTVSETHRLLQELQVHQVELEMQNEELVKTRNQVEKALSEYANLYNELYDFAPVGYLTLNSKGIISKVNLTGVNLLGVNKTRIVKQNFGSFISPGSRVLFTGFLAAVFASKIRQTCEAAIVTSGNETRYVHLVGMLSEDQEHCLLGIVDITSLKKAEEDVRKLNALLELRVEQRTAELARSNADLQAFSYSLSHDLRTPLRHLISFIELLANNLKSRLNEQDRHYLNVVWDSALKVNGLAEAILGFYRSSSAELRHTRVNMNLLVKEAKENVTPVCTGRNIRWECRTLPEVSGDPEMIKIVLINLLSNAAKYTSMKKNAVIEIGHQTDGTEEDIFYVKDNGMGFNSKDSMKLFTLFSRLGGARDYEGTGVGLASVRNIIQRHGGRTWAEGALNKGATFYFSIPKSKTN